MRAESAELSGYGLIDRLFEEDRATFLAHLAAVAADRVARAATVRLRRSGEGFAHVEIATGPATEDGVLVSALRESRARPDLAAELEAAREEARLEKSLKDRLLANMSHELRTPLNAILGFSEILGDPALGADRSGEAARIRPHHPQLRRSLLSVVNLVLDMSRIEAGKFAVAPEPLELEPLIRECCDMLRLGPASGRSRSSRRRLPEGLEIVADKARLPADHRQSAVERGQIHAAERPRRRRGQRRGRRRRASRVTDTGIGIKPDDLPRLGDPFFQVKSGYDRSYEGAGLGLSLVRGLVGLHDGSLVLESAYGVGTRVTVHAAAGVAAVGRAAWPRRGWRPFPG